MILVDTNVIVAALYDEHDDHVEALALFDTDRLLLLASHSHAEAYVTLTKRSGPAPIGWPGAKAREALASVRAATRLVGLTPAQTVDAVERFAEIGTGARLYDYIIGQAGLQHGAEAIVTFNLRHMRSLFPDLAVHAPAELPR